MATYDTTNDYASLRAKYPAGTPPVNLDAVFVEYSAGTVGIGGIFYYDADNNSSDNGGTIIVDSQNRRWKRVFDGPILAEWWGITAGSGALSQSLKLQAAADVAANIGGELRIGPFTYNVDQPLKVASGVTISGVDGLTTLRTIPGNWGSGVYHAVIQNLHFNPEAPDAPSEKDKDIVITGIAIFNTIVINNGIKCILMGGVDRVRIINCRFDGDVAAPYSGTSCLGCSDTWVDRCVANNAGVGFDHWFGARVAKVTNCIVRGVANVSEQGIQFTGAGTGNEGRNSFDCLIQGCSVYGVKNNGGSAASIIVNAVTAQSSVAKVRIIGNYVSDGNLPYVVSGSGTDFVVADNIADKCTNSGFQINPDGGISPNGVTLANHRIRDCTSLTGAMINIDGGSGHLIIGCSIEGGTYVHAVNIAASNWKADTNLFPRGSSGFFNTAGSTGSWTVDETEYGTWTPDLRFGGATVGLAYAVREGVFIRHGRVVHLFGSLTLSARGSSIGTALIFGIPYDGAAVGGGLQSAGIGEHANMISITDRVGYVVNTSAKVLIPTNGGSPSNNQLTDANFSSYSNLKFSLTYLIAQP